ncbi:MAG: ribbon-helix-helix protein, CopG family [Sporichthyaceae bacterium]
MAILTRRLQILLDEDRYQRLERMARARQISVATLIREAVDTAFPAQPVPRAEAGRRLLEAPPIAVEDWEALEGEIESMYEPGR